MDKMLGIQAPPPKAPKKKISFDDQVDKLSTCGDDSKLKVKLISMKKIANSLLDQILKMKTPTIPLKAHLPSLKEAVNKFQGILDQESPKPAAAKQLMVKYAKVFERCKSDSPL